MNIDKMTVKEAREMIPKCRELLAMFGENMAAAYSEDVEGHAYEVDTPYFIRTVTQYFIGRLSRVTPGELVLEDASWVADTGRFSDALATGELSEVEPYPGQCIVSRGAITDVSVWDHPLPRSQK